jgi:hypothetical protein
MHRTLLAAVVLAATAGSAAADKTDQSIIDATNVPADLQALGDKAGIWTDHPIDFSINPFYLRGDFDGDKRADYVVGVKGPADQDIRLVVLRGKGKPVWLDDAEIPARDGWWVVDKKTKIGMGAAGGKPPKLKGDAIMVIKAESSSAILYWKKTKFATYWQGD